jgi:hypothetical protein
VNCLMVSILKISSCFSEHYNSKEFEDFNLGDFSLNCIATIKTNSANDLRRHPWDVGLDSK